MSVDYLVVASSVLELEGFQTNLEVIKREKGHSFVLVCVGVGKVQSAALTLKAIMNYQPKAVLCLGYAGAVDPLLKIGDCIFASSVVQYDLDLRSFHLGRGEVPSASKGQTVGALQLELPQIAGILSGVCGTADRFLLRSFREENPWLSTDLHIAFADMESYAVAFACYTMQCPCTVCRVISDDEQGHRPKHFKEFSTQANLQFVKVLTALLDRTE
jgi:nucleoside phosphorylase